MQELQKMGRARENYRKRNNCVEIPSLECDIRVGELKPDQAEEDVDISINVIAPHESASRCMVKEAMILAGEISAKWGASQGIPLLYRCDLSFVAAALCMQYSLLLLIWSAHLL
jgi:exoribonuclease R